MCATVLMPLSSQLDGLWCTGDIFTELKKNLKDWKTAVAQLNLAFKQQKVPPVRLPVRPTVPLVRPYVRPPVRPSVRRPPIRHAIRPPVRPLVRPPVRPSARPSVRPSFRPPVHPSELLKSRKGSLQMWRARFKRKRR